MHSCVNGGIRIPHYVTSDGTCLLQDMWSHLESKLTNILCNAFVAMFEENPKVKEKFYSGLNADVKKIKNGERTFGKCHTLISVFFLVKATDFYEF